jgi:RNA polymerase sigma-70 factor, ECF subfamily
MTPEEIIDQALQRYERPLLSHARSITGDLESARDAVQETFLRLSRQDVRALQPRLAPWLFFVCRNCALDHQRKIVRFSDTASEEDPPSEKPGPADEAVANDESAMLRRLVGELSEQQRALVQLKFEADLTYEEIGEVMRMSVSNVGVQLHTAIQTLRTLWKRDNAGVLP